MRTETAWDQEAVFFRGDDYFNALIPEINRAQHSIQVESYIFLLDRAGRRLMRALRAAHRRGVQVRVLIDGLGNAQWTEKEVHWLQRHGIQTRIYHPAPWQRPYSWLRTFLWFLLFWENTGFRYLNRRNHRKTVLIDSKVCFVGGMNISEDTFESYKGPRFWRDCMVRVVGWQTSVLEKAFEAEWISSQSLRRRGLRDVTAKNASLVRINSSPALRKSHAELWIQSLEKAKDVIWVVTPYFAPTPRLLKQLIRSRRHGADVRILMPEISDVLLMDIINGSFIDALIKRGVKIYFYRRAVLHAKILYLGTNAIVGSSNWTYRSMRWNLEADVVVNRPQTLNEIQRELAAAFEDSLEVTLDAWRNRHWLRRLLEKVFSSWIRWV